MNRIILLLAVVCATVALYGCSPADQSSTSSGGSSMATNTNSVSTNTVPAK